MDFESYIKSGRKYWVVHKFVGVFHNILHQWYKLSLLLTRFVEIMETNSKFCNLSLYPKQLNLSIYIPYGIL